MARHGSPRSSSTLGACVEFVQSALGAEADPARAVAMAAYMKTDMPFYGVGKPQRTPILRGLVDMVHIEDRAAYEEAVLALWNLPHREEKYIAIGLARHHTAFVDSESLSLYRRLVVEGAWWDLVDDVAVHLVGHVLRAERTTTTPVVRAWGADPDMWLRRTALIAQIGHRLQTDERLLFDLCMAMAEEKEFFIRKAIGWALREYSKAAPDAVRRFVDVNGERLSGLSRREATRLLP